MSIGPVQNYIPVALASADAQPAQPRARRQVQPAPRTASPDAGNVPKQEAPVFKHAPPEASQPEGAVELQRDSELQNELIIRYVDGSGNLILQVPAEQVLKFQRAIAADFQRAAAAAEGTGQKGGSRGH